MITNLTPGADRATESKSMQRSAMNWICVLNYPCLRWYGGWGANSANTEMSSSMKYIVMEFVEVAGCLLVGRVSAMGLILSGQNWMTNMSSTDCLESYIHNHMVIVAAQVIMQRNCLWSSPLSHRYLWIVAVLQPIWGWGFLKVAQIRFLWL